MCSQLQPCANGATCSDMPNNYSCACASGFDGRTCETDLDMYGHPEQLYARPFLLPPSLLFEYILLGRCTHVAGLCLNGGTCNSTGPDRLVGLRNACGAERSQPASLSVYFALSVAPFLLLHCSYACHCSPDYSGSQCQINNNLCGQTEPCANGATCENVPDDYRCHCASGYGGRQCADDLDMCVALMRVPQFTNNLQPYSSTQNH